jgi:Leucine-rich repeat (LRR) protein
MVYGSLDKVGANDFNGLTTNEISIYYNGLKTIDPNAFNGLKFDPEEGLSLFFNYNNLTEISSAFKSINASSVYLLYNQISQIPDFAFSSCNQLSGCTNLLTNLFISNNPITTIGDNALANLPNLAQLDFSQLNLISIPVEAISKVAASLQIIDFTANQITKIEANSFYNFERLNSLSVNYNPIVNIELGAFNGMSSMQALLFMGLPRLTSVDLLITYGMEQVASLQFQYCPRLTNVTVLDAAKLPQTLETVTFSTGTNVQTLDSEFQSWLRQSPSKILDISNNVNLICNNSISWMAKFVICSPVQIITNGARCANSNTTLVDYLSNVKPTC